ncbi:MAG: heterocyst-inhibiting protein PatX [Dolichospermum sp.]
MRAAISLLVSSLVFSSLAFNCKVVQTHFSTLPKLKSDYQFSLLTKEGFAMGQTNFNLANNLKSSPNDPQAPNPHRGSGRKGLDG